MKYEDPGIQGWMLPIELEWLYTTAQKMKSIVEIGSWKGRSTHALLSGCTYEVTAVDHFKGSPGEEEHKEVDGDNIYNEFMKNVGHFPNLNVMRMSSLEAAKEFKPKSVDMVFIDAGHTYEDVCNDIEAWKGIAKKMIAGHDYLPEGWPEVVRAVHKELGGVYVVGTIWFQLIN